MMLFSSGDLVASEVLQFAQLQGFCLLLYFVSIDPIPRPPQYFGPVRLSHPAECNQSSPKSKCPLNQELLQIPEPNIPKLNIGADSSLSAQSDLWVLCRKSVNISSIHAGFRF